MNSKPKDGDRIEMSSIISSKNQSNFIDIYRKVNY